MLGLLAVLAVASWMLPFSWLLKRLLAPARSIWHGHTSHVDVARWNKGPRRGLEVTPRSYFAFLLTMAPFAVGMMLLPMGPIGEQLVRSDAWLIPAGLALICIGVMVCGFVLHALVNAFNRPARLVPPPYRDQPGWVAQRRARHLHGRGQVV